MSIPLSDTPNLLQQDLVSTQILSKGASISSLKKYQKNVSLIFDEMQTKSDLVNRRSTWKLFGFIAMGGINEEFQKFNENLCLEDNKIYSPQQTIKEI